MCGIGGILFRKGGIVDPDCVRRMTDAMAHRGPDADDFFNEQEIGLGHRRLSIIDLSAAADQPFIDNSGRYIMVFNGEMYNYLEVKALLPDYEFRTHGDSEVLLAAYIKWGPPGLNYFRGMFACVIWDRQEKEIFLARDRMGVKPLYYYLDEEQLLFASETRAILATGLVKKTIDTGALLEYFSYQSVSFPYSVIEGIGQLEAGSWMKIKGTKIETQRYWELTRFPGDTDLVQPRIASSVSSDNKAAHSAAAHAHLRSVVDPNDPGRVHRHIRDLLLQSVERRLVSDVPVGAFLSGGIDSSAIVGLMAEAGSAAPNTFNISFEEKEYDESSYADIVAKKFNTHHTRILLKPTVFLEELRNALDAMDTPSGDGINTYVVSKAIREKNIKVALSGIGGDELFAGYPFFSQYLQLQNKSWLWGLPSGLRKMIAATLPGKSDGRKGRMIQLLSAPGCTIDQAYPIFRQLLSPRLIEELTTLPGHGLSPSGGRIRSSSGSFITSVQRDLTERKAALARLPLLSQVSAAEFLGYTQHTLLKDTDQMSMAHSLEVREPFFDQDLVEFVLAVPDTLKRPRYPKSLLVESLKPLLPAEIVFRKKQGFTFPWNLWLRRELRSFCDTHINNMAQRPFINGKQLRAYWQRFLAGDKQVRWAEIWLFVVLEYWLEKNT